MGIYNPIATLHTLNKQLTLSGDSAVKDNTELLPFLKHSFAILQSRFHQFALFSPWLTSKTGCPFQGRIQNGNNSSKALEARLPTSVNSLTLTPSANGSS